MKDRLRLVFAVLGVVLIAASAGEPGSCDRDSGDEAALADVEAGVVRQINEYRAGKGLRGLRVDRRLLDQARRHSASMAAADVPFGHDGFRERLAGSGVSYRAAAENVGQNEGFSRPAAQAVASWLESRSHRSNIEGEFDLTGVGVSRSSHGVYYFTQMFVLEKK